ncbi:hypothetical protein FACS1894158_01580 [Betaproteobacteria bacterium]|nr:hypothetical protein FACS1894158_01580 [Betaproteobacteria bacterium]
MVRMPVISQAEESKQKPPPGLHRRGFENRLVFRLPSLGPRRCVRYDYADYADYAYYRYYANRNDQRNSRHRRGDERKECDKVR